MSPFTIQACTPDPNGRWLVRGPGLPEYGIEVDNQKAAERMRAVLHDVFETGRQIGRGLDAHMTDEELEDDLDARTGMTEDERRNIG